MSFGEAIKSVFSKYAVFSGRARRSEYWYFALFYFLVGLALDCIPFLNFLSFIWILAMLIPSITVSVRRLHDIGKSGWNFLIVAIPQLLLIGYLVYIFFLVFIDLTEADINFYNLSDNLEVAIDIIKNSFMANTSSLATLGIIGIIDFAATILWLVWMTRDSQPGENQWGPNPKEQPENTNNTY